MSDFIENGGVTIKTQLILPKLDSSNPEISSSSSDPTRKSPDSDITINNDVAEIKEKGLTFVETLRNDSFANKLMDKPTAGRPNIEPRTESGALNYVVIRSMFHFHDGSNALLIVWCLVSVKDTGKIRRQ
jgi:hypothetical protein